MKMLRERNSAGLANVRYSRMALSSNDVPSAIQVPVRLERPVGNARQCILTRQILGNRPCERLFLRFARNDPFNRACQSSGAHRAVASIERIRFGTKRCLSASPPDLGSFGKDADCRLDLGDAEYGKMSYLNSLRGCAAGPQMYRSSRKKHGKRQYRNTHPSLLCL